MVKKQTILDSPHLWHGVTRRRGLGGLPLHTRGGVNSVLLGFALGIQRNVWRRVTDLHSCLWCGQDHRWWGHWCDWSLHRHHRRHRRGLSGHGALQQLTAIVCRGVHGGVYWLLGGQLWGQGAHCGIEMPLRLLGGGRNPSLPPWYPAELPGDKERDPEQSQAAGGHNQRQQADGNIWKGNERNRNESAANFYLFPKWNYVWREKKTLEYSNSGVSFVQAFPLFCSSTRLIRINCIYLIIFRSLVAASQTDYSPGPILKSSADKTGKVCRTWSRWLQLFKLKFTLCNIQKL